MTFDPFESRWCRHIRNTIGHGFIKSLKKQDINPFTSIVHDFESKKISPDIRVYIQHRQTCLEKILNHLKTMQTNQDYFFEIATFLWNHELFFEVHEWLETKWISAKKDRKKSIQALILSAIVYEQLQYNRKNPAKKNASKAIALLEQYRAIIPKPFDSDILIEHLFHLNPMSPKFNK